MSDSDNRTRNSLRKAIDEIVKEREYQSNRWGDEHDKGHSPEEWTIILSIYVSKAMQETSMYQGRAFEHSKFRKRLVQIGAIAAAAMEAQK